MASMGLQLLGCSLALIGWVGAILACGLPTWRVTAFVGSNIVTSQIFWEGIWMSCVVQSTGQMQCKVYDSMLALSSDLQAARALMVVSIIAGIVGLFMAFVSGKCTNFIAMENRKRRAIIATGVVLIISGVLCLIPVCWTASTVIREFYNPALVAAQKRELGASIYIGWGASFLLVIGGALLCSFCPRQDDQTPSLKYQLVNKSRSSSRNTSLPSHVPPAPKSITSITSGSKTYI